MKDALVEWGAYSLLSSDAESELTQIASICLLSFICFSKSGVEIKWKFKFSELYYLGKLTIIILAPLVDMQTLHGILW